MPHTNSTQKFWFWFWVIEVRGIKLQFNFCRLQDILSVLWTHFDMVLGISLNFNISVKLSLHLTKQWMSQMMNSCIKVSKSFDTKQRLDREPSSFVTKKNLHNKESSDTIANFNKTLLYLKNAWIVPIYLIQLTNVSCSWMQIDRQFAKKADTHRQTSTVYKKEGLINRGNLMNWNSTIKIPNQNVFY